MLMQVEAAGRAAKPQPTRRMRLAAEHPTTLQQPSVGGDEVEVDDRALLLGAHGLNRELPIDHLGAGDPLRREAAPRPVRP
jgi:hypothetical protein